MARGMPRRTRGKRLERKGIDGGGGKKRLGGLDLMHGFTGIVDRKGKLQFVSEAPLRNLGYSEDNILRKPFWEAEWFSPSSMSQQAVKECLTEALEGKGSQCRVEAFTKEGDPIPVTFTMSPLKGREGNIVSIMAEARPSTEEVEFSSGEEEGIPQDIICAPGESQPYVKAECFRALIDDSSDAFVIVDGDLRFIYANHALKQLLGLDPEKLQGMVSMDFVHPDDLPNAFAALANVLEEPGGIGSVDLRIQTEQVDSWRWMRCMGQNMLDDMRVEGIVITYHDITDRIEAQQKLRDSEERFRSLIENASDAISIIGRDGIVVYDSPSVERVLGYEPGSLVGTNAFNLIHPDDMASIAGSLGDWIDSPGKTSSMEARCLHNDGSWGWIEIVGQNLLDKPEVQGIVINYRDVTDRKQSEEELRQSEAKLQDLVERLRFSQEELSTPVVQIWDRILVLPLIGVLDSSRAQRVMEVLLGRVVDTQSEMVILDVTGINSMDTEVTNNLVRTIQSTSLLGARCVVTGIKPDVAQSMSQLGVDVGKLVTKRDLQDGLRYALQTMGYDLNSGRGASDQ